LKIDGYVAGAPPLVLKFAVLTDHDVPLLYVRHCCREEFHSLAWIM
jgi:hypothetical protein